jgi:hypothetical protein
MRTPRQSAQLLLLSAGSLCAAMLGAQTPATQPAPPTQSATIHHPRPTAAHPAATASVEPPPPPIPDWPINDQPSPAAVEFDASGLHIYATNSSLQQILAAVTLATGSKVDGFAKDQRVYGNFGPGQPREVLAQLLQGSGYNIVMVGDQGHGAPREILLSSRSAASGAQPGGNRNQSQADNDDDSNDNQVEFQPPQPAQQMQPQQGPPGRQGFGGSDGNGPQRTPQQIQQELMQRQQQLLQQQQQQQQQLQQTTTPPPNQ